MIIFYQETKKKQFFIYFKEIHPNKLKIMIKSILKLKLFDSYEYKIFHYKYYKEIDYLTYISECEFGIWVGRSESLGYAAHESLSCNTPLFVYDCVYFKEEYIDNNFTYINFYKELVLKSTSLPYFDNTCGLIYRDENMNNELTYMKSIKTNNNLTDSLKLFIDNLNTYKPRDYILNNLSVIPTLTNLLKFFNKI